MTPQHPAKEQNGRSSTKKSQVESLLPTWIHPSVSEPD
jgi:hypothetical protein